MSHSSTFVVRQTKVVVIRRLFTIQHAVNSLRGHNEAATRKGDFIPISKFVVIVLTSRNLATM